MSEGAIVRPLIMIGRYPPEFAGHGIQVHRMLPYLIEEGVEPTVLAYRPAADLVWSHESDAGRVERTLAPERGRFSGARRVVQVRAHVRRHRGDYDLVHSTLVGWELLANVSWLRRRGFPVVYEMILVGSDDPVAISNYRFGRWKLDMLRPVDAWVGITEAFRPRLRTAGIPAERFHCIYGGVDVERYRPVGPEERVQLRAELGLPRDGRVVVSAGAVLPRKGFDRLLRAWHALRPDPARDRLVIAGPATVAEGVAPRFAGHKGELERFVAEAGLGQSVRIIGRVDDLERWYAASDVFAFLSRREGMGYVIVEAMASGLPCVVSPLDGIGRELLREGLTGTVVEHPDDPELVAASLRGLLEDPERRRAWGAAGREDALARFSLRSRARTMAELYREVAARGVAGPKASAPWTARSVSG